MTMLTEEHHNYSTREFVAKIQQLLIMLPHYLDTNSDYIDLSMIRHLSTNDIAQFDCLPTDNPLNLVFFYIIEEASNSRLDHLKLGCNEMLKSLVLHVNRDNQELITNAYTEKINLIFIWCLDFPFIYISHFWHYLIDCLYSVTHYILDQEYFDSSLILINHLGSLGQGAVKHGLSTQRLQRVLRTVEVKAEEMSWIQGSRQCRQQRHDIEIV
ncbi:MAG: hypothetical protein SCK28_06760 [Bacillota bacterium]|nr:hypothetical protein [Bacillota bacterium]